MQITSSLIVKDFGAKVVSHARYVTFQLAEVLLSRSVIHEILERIQRLKLPAAVTGRSLLSLHVEPLERKALLKLQASFTISRT